jgi:hypothetical protein
VCGPISKEKFILGSLFILKYESRKIAIQIEPTIFFVLYAFGFAFHTLE